MNRREFLKSILTATAAAAVAGLRPRPEPTEVVTRLGRGSRDTLDNFGIPAEDVKLAVHKWRETNVGVDGITLADDCHLQFPHRVKWWHDSGGYLIPPECQAELMERLERITEEPAPCA